MKGTKYICDDIWNDQSLAPDSDLPPGWRTIRDNAGTYYWHVPSGTTQWQHPSYSEEGERQSPCLSQGGKLMLRGRSDRSKVVATIRSSLDRSGSTAATSDSNPRCFAVRSLGWVEIPEEELAPGKSSLAVNNCIQQLSHSKAEGRDAVGAWGEGQDMDVRLIHCQPIVNIRVWGICCGLLLRHRDFAFVASDKDTCLLKCHVFRCSAPAKTIATALHEMCSKVRAHTRRVNFLDAVRQRVQKFEVEYVGNLPVSRAMGSFLGVPGALPDLPWSCRCWYPAF
uniref:WW domain-containing protein n=1 Tax=Electrophorus electricus TaxID=8005 RepID=A0AAY5EFU5_ELEEL